MAKRVRGSQSTHKPGGQGPSRTKKTSSDPQDAATATEADIVATDGTVDIDGAMDSVVMQTTELAIEEPVAAAPTPRRRTRRGAKAKADSLESRAAAEDVYVHADLRRIGIVSGMLFVALIVAWLLVVPMNVLGLY